MGSLWLFSVELGNLLPQLADVLVVPIDVSVPVVVISARTRSRPPAGCTGCGALSACVHSRYVRRLADAVLGGRPFRIDVSVRRCVEVRGWDAAQVPYLGEGVRQVAAAASYSVSWAQRAEAGKKLPSRPVAHALAGLRL
ncbi:hypothetical protein ACIGW8_36790 [Streptomyces sioyaensis]|uniref:hypothetical protein n=1 Tax=Streptomyces sioyaensis TaxID=67364 RepID=UPI0037D37219